MKIAVLAQLETQMQVRLSLPFMRLFQRLQVLEVSSMKNAPHAGEWQLLPLARTQGQTPVYLWSDTWCSSFFFVPLGPITGVIDKPPS